jgi:alpha-L-rhamnosidase
MLVLMAVVVRAPAADRPTANHGALTWPAATQTARPWTRWWWHGSAVDKENLSRLLAKYRDAGLGGVEITCIYGVRGEEQRDLPYLSDAWIEALVHTINEAQRLELGVDLPTGSGWRMGGPSVSQADADLKLVLEGDPLKPQKITQRWAGDPVKRAAPGGEGRSINPYSKRAVTDYLIRFAAATEKLPKPGIRAQVHDSFEYDGDWCDDFLAEFAARRGYRLEEHLPALAGQGDAEDVARVKCDYRETLSDLVHDNFILPWVEWSHSHGMLARNQSHGSPANWLDLYAACDIQETESYGRLVGGNTDPLVFQFASSAAHVAGRPLVASETATWLDEHFQVTLGQIKEIVDRLFLAGVNHVIYHGTAYSPQDAAWPGWVFYASTQLNPGNPIWRDLPALNLYVTRCQSILQSTQPDNDILLYWPIHDVWHDPEGLRKDMQVHNAAGWFSDTPFGRIAAWLTEHGYTFDYVSDRQLGRCRVVEGRIQTPGASYQMVLVPGAEHMPTDTLKALIDLAEAGARIGFLGRMPAGPPGLVTDEQRAVWDELMGRLKFADLPADQQLSSKSWVQEISLGRGRVLESPDWAAVLQAANVRREYFGPLPTSFGGSQAQLRFLRRVSPAGHIYFIKNESNEPFDDWISPTGNWASAAIMDPLDGRIGLAAVRVAEFAGNRQLRLQLAAGKAVFVKTLHELIDGPSWTYRKPAGQPIPIVGRWSVDFVEGGPELPGPFTTSRLKSWTELAGAEGQRFAGTARYTLTFDAPADAQRYLLSLGTVADSARVELNGQPVATLFVPPLDVELGPLSKTDNRLVVEVTNVAANRIRDLDRRQVPWRVFHDINFVNIDYQPFDASGWPIRDAGLMGPVALTPLEANSDP